MTFPIHNTQQHSARANVCEYQATKTRKKREVTSEDLTAMHGDIRSDAYSNADATAAIPISLEINARDATPFITCAPPYLVSDLIHRSQTQPHQTNELTPAEKLSTMMLHGKMTTSTTYPYYGGLQSHQQ